MPSLFKKSLFSILGLLIGVYLFSIPLSAHNIDRLHEHIGNNTYRNTPRPVQIRFTAPRIAGGPLKVITRFQANSKDHTLLGAQHSWAGTSNEHNYFDIKAYSDNGERMLLSKTAKKQWRVNSHIGQWIEIHYSIAPNKNAKNSNTQYRAILNKDLFHAIGQLFLVLPDDKMTDLLNVNVQWQDFEAINWQTVQAVAGNSQQDKYEILSKSALLSSVFMAGDIQLHQTLTPYGVIKIAMQKNNWHFKGEEFASLARQIVQSEREFFGVEINPEAEPFLISLVEVEKDLNGISIGGTSLHNSFAMFASPSAKLMQTDFSEPNTTIGFVLAHEMMHQWIGHGVKTSEKPEALGYWFTEGFTDYFSLQVLYKRQLITLDNYVEMMNSFLRNYWLNPKRNISNQNIASGFWTNKNIERLPYQRGFLIAMLSDQKMRLVNDSRLRDMLQKMLDHSDGVANHTAVSNRSLLFNIQNRVGEALGKHLKNVVYNGKTINLKDQVLSPCLKFVNTPMGDYDPGFDLDKSELKKRISGLNQKSDAYKAGLRNGQELAGWNISGNPAIKASVSIYVDKLGSVKTFEFYPVSDTTLVPQANIMNRETCSAIL
jgi:predicted metalloprotease with PDZ domain